MTTSLRAHWTPTLDRRGLRTPLTFLLARISPNSSWFDLVAPHLAKRELLRLPPRVTMKVRDRRGAYISFISMRIAVPPFTSKATWFTKVPDRNGRVVRHSAAISENVGLAVGVEIMSDRDRVAARHVNWHTEAHRLFNGGHINSFQPAPLFEPIRFRRAIDLDTNCALRPLYALHGCKHRETINRASLHIIANRLSRQGRRYD